MACSVCYMRSWAWANFGPGLDCVLCGQGGGESLSGLVGLYIAGIHEVVGLV